MKKSNLLVLLEYLPVLVILPLLRIIPYKLGLSLSRGLGISLYYLLGNYRNIAGTNLRIAFGKELSAREARDATKAAFVNMAQTCFEFIALPRLSLAQIQKLTMDPVGYDQYKAAVACNKGVIVVSMHFSNWYWPVVCATLEGFKVNVVVRPLDNPRLDRLMNQVFERAGIGVIPRHRVMPDAVTALRRGETVALMIDQNSAGRGCFVEFFGTTAATMRGLPILRRGTNAEVVSVYDLRKGIRHKVVMSHLVDLPENEYDCLLATHRYFEPVIAANKGHYFWLHPRWKSRPKGGESLYKNLRV